MTVGAGEGVGAGVGTLTYCGVGLCEINRTITTKSITPKNAISGVRHITPGGHRTILFLQYYSYLN